MRAGVEVCKVSVCGLCIVLGGESCMESFPPTGAYCHLQSCKKRSLNVSSSSVGLHFLVGR